MNKKIIPVGILLIIIYLVVTFWKISFTPFNAHADGLWYLKVAENVATGKGLVENVVWHFYPRLPVLKEFPHPVGTYWNPLDSIIIASFYKIFGISIMSGRLPAILMDALMVLFILWFFSSVFPDNLWIPSLSALIYIIHPIPLDMRALSGVPETFDIFFITFSCFFMFKALTSKGTYAILSGFFGGLAYMSRNEGLWTLGMIVLVYLYVRFILCKNVPGKTLIFGIAAFIITIAPLEIRNYSVFGSHAHEMKRHLSRITEFWDVWVFDFENKLGTVYGSDFVNFIVRKFSSYYYKAETIIDLVTWPLAVLIPLGIIKNTGRLEFKPAGFYLLVSYIVMGWFFSAAQRSGFHAASSILPFLVPLGVSGAFYFSSRIIQKSERAKLFGIFIVALLFFYYFAVNVKVWKENRNTGENMYAASSKVIYDWLAKEKKTDSVIMIHMPVTFNYYTDLKMVQIPTNNPIASINKAVKYYNCEYLVLVGNIPSVFAPMYAGCEKIPGYRLAFEKDLPYVVPIIGGGNKIKIFKIDPGKLK
jgi:hypothetical protein